MNPTKPSINRSHQFSTSLLCATVFLSSACLMVLEIVAGRILAPFIGASLYTWTSIIGVILGGISLGNWLGGRYADKGWGFSHMGFVLMSAAIMTVLILPLLVFSGRALQAMETDLMTASLLYVLVLFFLPAVFIGIISPLATTLYLALDERTGTVLGRMHALSAVGSILGTFLAGFVLIQWIGTRSIVLWVAGLLVVLAVLFFYKRNVSRVSISIGIGLLAGASVWGVQSGGLVSPCDVESHYYCLRVVEEPGSQEGNRVRSLVLDHMLHSTNVASNPEDLRTPYIQVMDALINMTFDNLNAGRFYFAGGGAYTFPRLIRSRYRVQGNKELFGCWVLNALFQSEEIS